MLHRLRNDLNVVALGLSLLKRQLERDASAETRDMLRRIELAAQRCAKAVAATEPR
ncbi:histidine kinase dimerization/phospho-acceptor domain-containing protein [Stenotrophomonas sp. MYb238]|uniref:histidine kinase dimerization/phospho-acceptor domain-containing protein n=1 Tax=Stenotrophomonas sp. MYb238 TaxID=2040281 RepID=UPI001D170D4E|nr:histidine kinase dimerization/phospho-acceptor domain-containing protein [Stenotrophomonas sp. MYb238]